MIRAVCEQMQGQEEGGAVVYVASTVGINALWPMPPKNVRWSPGAFSRR